MQVVGFACSPRLGGNTESLLDLALAEIAGEGTAVVKHRIAKLDIRPCVAHPGCRERDDCLLTDDFAAVAESAMEADAVIFAVPVYYWGVPAQFKAFIDRHVHYYGLRKYQARAIGLIVIAGDDGLEEAEDQMHSFLVKGGHGGIAWDDVLIVRGYANARGEAVKLPELAEAACSLGREIRQRLRPDV
jgi:multimeric flavodoxin WrbA